MGRWSTPDPGIKAYTVVLNADKQGTIHKHQAHLGGGSRSLRIADRFLNNPNKL
jgi:hypothetical protein